MNCSPSWWLLQAGRQGPNSWAVTGVTCPWLDFCGLFMLLSGFKSITNHYIADLSLHLFAYLRWMSSHWAWLCCQGNIWLVFIQIFQHVGQGLPVRSLWCTLLLHLSKHASCKKSWLASIPAGSLLLLPSSPCSSVLQLIRSQASFRVYLWGTIRWDANVVRHVFRSPPWELFFLSSFSSASWLTLLPWMGFDGFWLNFLKIKNSGLFVLKGNFPNLNLYYNLAVVQLAALFVVV